MSLFGDMTFPENPAFRQAESDTFGNGGTWPVIKGRPFRRVSDPEGEVMFIEQLRRAVEASPRAELPTISALLWKAYAAGTVSESDAADLSAAIEARKALPAAPKPVQRRFGSRRSDASMERRRRWAVSGCLPPQIAAKFTLAEQSVLAVVAAENRK